jgi:hypothetical protein
MLAHGEALKEGIGSGVMTRRSEALDAPELEAFVEIHPGDERGRGWVKERNARQIGADWHFIDARARLKYLYPKAKN